MRYWVTLAILFFIVLVLASFTLNAERAKNEKLQAQIDSHYGYLVQVQTTGYKGDNTNKVYYLQDDEDMCLYLTEGYFKVAINVVEVME